VQQGHEEDGVPVFEERAEAYGIADTSYTTHAAFFDYDRDGDLDLYVLNNEMPGGDQNQLRPRRTDGKAPSTDRLYRNDGDGTFTDVSEETGITIEGYGLGVGIGDVNKDGWPDIYVANDFITNDLLYINNGDGTFTNRIDAYLTHQSHSAMGVDLADFNNDTRPDIMVLDMLPPGPPRRKMVSTTHGYTSPRRAHRLGYELQYTRNILQLNNGRTPEGSFRFSEISQLAGVDATDWSWTPLFADFDNNGDLDLFVSNGYGEDVTNLDFARRRQQMLAFGTDAAQREELLEAMKALPKVELSNYFFRNKGRPGEGSLRLTPNPINNRIN
jgi:hypothetical protein